MVGRFVLSTPKPNVAAPAGSVRHAEPISRLQISLAFSEATAVQRRGMCVTTWGSRGLLKEAVAAKPSYSPVVVFNWMQHSRRLVSFVVTPVFSRWRTLSPDVKVGLELSTIFFASARTAIGCTITVG